MTLIKPEYKFSEITPIDLAALKAQGYEAILDGDAKVVRVTKMEQKS